MRGRGCASVAFAAAFGLVLFQMRRVGGVVWFVANDTSAAWLLLPFLVGAMHPELRRAVGYGMAAPAVGGRLRPTLRAREPRSGRRSVIRRAS